jgi:16S rRNA (cytosine1402-N4)-methyltransferase
MVHKPVLLKEVMENLKLEPGMTVVDGTLGAGGHSLEILKRILPGGKLISIDWDKRAVRNFKKKLEEEFSIAKRKLIHKAWRGVVDNYANIGQILRGLGIQSVEAIFVDLGFSSDQIEDPQRGFSFLHNGPLDMRYSPEKQKKTAADIVNSYPEERLVGIFKNYGEEKFARKIARGIKERRKTRKIRETRELVEIILDSIPAGKYQRARIHPATKVFQALRIETNQELENLKKFLPQAIEALASEGRLAIISFHSLEDRLVKSIFREESRDCLCPPTFPQCVCGHQARLKIITKRPIIASEKEIRENPRARSAKLRVAQKI